MGAVSIIVSEYVVLGIKTTSLDFLNIVDPSTLSLAFNPSLSLPLLTDATTYLFQGSNTTIQPLTTNLPYLIQYSPFPSDTITSLIPAGNSNSQILVNSNHTVLSSGIKGIYLECFKAADDSVNTIFNLFLKKK